MTQTRKESLQPNFSADQAASLTRRLENIEKILSKLSFDQVNPEKQKALLQHFNFLAEESTHQLNLNWPLILSESVLLERQVVLLQRQEESAFHYSKISCGEVDKTMDRIFEIFKLPPAAAKDKLEDLDVIPISQPKKSSLLTCCLWPRVSKEDDEEDRYLIQSPRIYGYGSTNNY